MLDDVYGVCRPECKRNAALSDIYKIKLKKKRNAAIIY